MKAGTPPAADPLSQRGFTLLELMVATVIGASLAGVVLLLLSQAASEQRNGFADTTVEEQAYMLEANITACLRSMSANQGFTPNYSTAQLDTNGNLLGYKSIFLFYPTNGAYTTATIAYSPSNGQVLFTPNIMVSSTQLWMSNGPCVALTELYFSCSFNPDGSQNNSLVNVAFQMNDNGFSRQNPRNNPTSVFRNFSVQMRNDN